MKKFFKNHSKKLIAFIGVMFTCIFSILGITKTYAWTYNEASDTFTSDNLWWYEGSVGKTNQNLFQRIDISSNPLVGGTYTISANVSSTSPTASGIRIALRDINQSSINYFILSIGQNSSATFTFSSDCYYLFIYAQEDTSNNTYQSSLTDIMLVSGSTAQAYEPYGATYINQNEYNDLQDNYNDLVSYNDGGIFNYLTRLSSYGDHSYNFTRDGLVANGTISGSTFDYANLFNLYPNISSGGNGNVLGRLYFDSIDLTTINLKINTNMTFTEDILLYVNLVSNEMQLANVPYVVAISNSDLIAWNYTINYENIEPLFYNDIKFNRFYSLSFGENIMTSDDTLSITSMTTPYQAGYISGYNNGYHLGQDSRNNEVNNLQNTITSLQDQTTDLQRTINSLTEQIESFSSDYNLNSLMWTIAGTPFEAFKNIWDVNFFGVNLSTFILGFITTFIGLYILKKFFF